MLKQLHMLTLVVCMGAVLSACQPKTNEPLESSASEPVQTIPEVQEKKLVGKVERLSWDLPVCKAKNCAEISVERLQSNYPFIDEWVDQQILAQLKQIVDLDPVAALNNSPQDDHTATSEVMPVVSAKQQIEQHARPYIDGFLALDRELKALSASQHLSVTIKPTILNSSAQLSTVVLNSSSYLGGAHGSSAQSYYHFDLNTEQRVQLKDILLAKQEKALEKKAYEAFQAWVIDTELAENVKEYEEVWTFKLTDNFFITKESLILQYAEYEIGPYVVGLPRLTIPLNELEGIVKPEYLPQTSAHSEAASDKATL